MWGILSGTRRGEGLKTQDIPSDYVGGTIRTRRQESRNTQEVESEYV
jgi:hypothetical protein